MSKAEHSYTIEAGTAINPHAPTHTAELFDVFLIVDESGAEVARAYTPEAAAAVAAALELVQHAAHVPTVDPVAGKEVRCPACLGTESRVTDSRSDATGIIRRRTCLACAARYKTIEQVTTLTTPGRGALPHG